MLEVVAKHSVVFKLISKQGTAGTISSVIEDVEQQELSYIASKDINQHNHFEESLDYI